MTQDPKKQNDWQGFQHFQDTTLPTLPCLPQINKLKPILHKTQNPYTLNKKNNPHPQKISINKRSEPRNLPSPERLESLEKSYKSVTTPLKITQEKTPPNQTRTADRKYQRIPIMKFEQEYRYPGKIIYKNFTPRTSDHYMRLLKQVDWSIKAEKKRDIRNLHGIEFNSQFQGGNLNLAVQGVRSLV